MNIVLKRFTALSFLIITALNLFGQSRPFITGFSPTSAAPGETLIISGFNLPTADFKIKIGGVAADVTGTPSSERIDVIVPLGASVATITVVNENTGLSGTSSVKFIPSFGGEVFDASFLANVQTIETNQNRLLDLVVADFNGDGKVDVISTDNNSPTISILTNTSTLGNPAFSVNSSLRNTGNTFNQNIASGDLNNNGKEDLIITQAVTSGTNNNFYIFRNTSTTGTINFAAAIQISIPNKPTSGESVIRTIRRVEIADVDGDGRKDVVINNNTDGSVFIYLNNSTNETISLVSTPFELKGTNFGNREPKFWGLEVKDLNADGLPEIITADNQGDGFIHIFQNRSREGAIAFNTDQRITTVQEPLNLKLADFDNDGFDDIAVTHPRGGEIGLHRNNSSQSLGNISFEQVEIINIPTTIAGSDPGPWGLDASDINGDGKIDIITADSRESAYNILINNSSKGDIIMNISRLPLVSDSRNIKAIDIDGNGKPEIIVAGESNQKLILIENLLCQSPRIDELPESLRTLCGTSSQEISVPNIPNTNYAWERAASSGAAFSATGTTTSNLLVTTPGEYRVIASSPDNTCRDTSNVISFIDEASAKPAPPVFSLLPTGTICQGDTISLSVESRAGISNVWVQPDRTTPTNTLTLRNVQSEQSGVYTVFAVDEATNCRSDSITTDLTVTTIPDIVISTNADTLFCEGEFAQLITQNYPSFDYDWQTDSTSTTLTSRDSFQVSTSGSYSLVITDPSTGCTDRSNTINFRRARKPLLAITAPDVTCIDVNTDVSTVINRSEEDLTLETIWKADGEQRSAEAAPVLSFSSAKDFELRLVGSYSELPTCIDSTTKSITVRDIPDLNITVSSVSGQTVSASKCPLDTVKLSFPSNLTNYQWFLFGTGDTTVIDTDSTVNIVQSASYGVSAVNDINCTIEAQQVISDLPNSGLDVIYEGEVINNQTVILEQSDLSPVLMADRGSDFSWSPSGLFEKPNADETAFFPRKDTTILLSGTDTNGCSDSVTVSFTDERILEEKALSLSGFGGDNCWEISNTSALQECTIHIFDNKGVNVLVENFSNLSSDTGASEDCVWNGQSGSVNVPAGIYYYTVKCPSGNGVSFSGSIIVVP